MMALLRFCKLSTPSRSNPDHISRVFKLSPPYSTETTNILQQSPQISKKNVSLWERISPVGNPKASLIPIIDQWKREGNDLRPVHFIKLIKRLRTFNRYAQALELSEWVANRSESPSPTGVAIHLDLLSRVKGVEQVEKYFSSIPDHVKDYKVYGALLCCYAHKKSIKKAEDMAEKMRKMGMMNTLSYNLMLSLYKDVGAHEKLHKIYEEMLEKPVPCDKTTYYILLNAYASSLDLERMESLLKQMEETFGRPLDCNTYTIASNGYLKSGLEEKAFEMLQRAEKCVHGKNKEVAWHVIIYQYSVLGKKEDVYRTWNLYKSSLSKVFNRGYICVIGALLRLDDIDGAEKLLTEWESANLTFDFKVPNLLIEAYCKKGSLEKAEAYVDRVMDVGKLPPASTWSLLASAYARENQIEKAVEMLKNCASMEEDNGVKLDQGTLRVCMEHLRANGDRELAEDIKRTLQERFHIPESAFAESSADEISDAGSLEEMEERCQ